MVPYPRLLRVKDFFFFFFFNIKAVKLDGIPNEFYKEGVTK